MIWILSNLVNQPEIIFDKTSVLQKIVTGSAVVIYMAALIKTFIFSSRKFGVLFFQSAVGSEKADLKIVECERKKAEQQIAQTIAEIYENRVETAMPLEDYFWSK